MPSARKISRSQIFPWTGLSSVGRLNQVSRLQSGPLLNGTLPNIQSSWSPQTAAQLPATATYALNFEAQVLTTGDGENFWFQKAEIDEPAIHGIRRQHNLLRLDPTWALFGATTEQDLGGGITQFANLQSQAGDLATKDVSGSTDLEGDRFAGYIEIRGVDGENVDIELKRIGGAFAGIITNIVLTGNFVAHYLGEFTAAAGNTGASYIIRNNGTTNDADVIDIRNEGIVNVTGSPAGMVPELVNDKTEYLGTSVSIAGIRYFSTTNTNTADVGTGEITFNTGLNIPDGYFFRVPEEEGLMPESNDASSLISNLINTTPLAIGPVGLKSDRLDDGTSNGFHGVRALDLAGTEVNTRFVLRGIFNDEDATYVYFRGPSNGATGEFPWAVFNLALGTFQVGTGDTLDKAVMKPLGGGRYDCRLHLTTAATIGNGGIWFMLDPSGGVPGDTASTPPVYTGVQQSVVIHYAQVIAAADVGSPVLTTGTTVTKPANSLTDGVWAGAPIAASATIDATVADLLPLNEPMKVFGFGISAAAFVGVDNSDRMQMVSGTITPILTAGSSYESERHGYGFSLQTAEGIIVDDEVNDNTDSAGAAAGGGAVHVGSASDLSGLPCAIHAYTLYEGPQSVEQLKQSVPEP